MQLEKVPVADLKEYGRNSRTHSDQQIKQLAASITEFGWTNPLLIDERHTLIAGHGRLAAARLLGMQTVPCVKVSGLSEDQRRALVIADNKLAMSAGWDEEMLASELALLKEADFNLDILGFSTTEIAGLLDMPSDGKTDPDAAPATPDVATTIAGDLWVMGKHRLLCGDSTSVDAVKALMGGGLADMFLTDPPYNVAYEGKTKDALKIKNDSMGDTGFRAFLVAANKAADAVMKAGAVFYIWYADVESYNFTGSLVDTGWQLRQILIWKKNSLVMGRKDYHFQHEPCIYGWKDGAGHLWASDRKQTTILEFDRPTRSLEHPTMKPVALFEYQLLNNTKGGDLCLDLFGGSGTTLIACEKNGRYARLMELDPKYCDVIVRRWQEFTGRTACLEATGQSFDEVAAIRKE